MTREHPRTDRLFEIGSALSQAKVLLSAVELGVFRSSQPAPSMRRISPAAFRSTVARLATSSTQSSRLVCWRETTKVDIAIPRRAIFLDRASRLIRPSFDQYNRREYALWGSLTQSLQTGNPAAETHGQDPSGRTTTQRAFRTFAPR